MGMAAGYGWQITRHHLTLHEKRQMTILVGVLYISLSAYQLFIPFALVLVVMMYLTVTSFTFMYINRNLGALRLQLMLIDQQRNRPDHEIERQIVRHMLMQMRVIQGCIILFVFQQFVVRPSMVSGWYLLLIHVAMSSN